jgi:hypothetical protein
MSPNSYAEKTEKNMCTSNSWHASCTFFLDIPVRLGAMIAESFGVLHKNDEN